MGAAAHLRRAGTQCRPSTEVPAPNLHPGVGLAEPLLLISCEYRTKARRTYSEWLLLQCRIQHVRDRARQVALAGKLVGLGSGQGDELWAWEGALDAGALLQRLVREQRDALAAVKRIIGARIAALKRHSL